MDEGDVFNRGASIPRLVTLTYEDTGLPIDTDDLDEVAFSVIHAVTTRELDNFSLVAGTVEVIDHTAGQVRYIIPKSVSTLGDLGNYYANVATEETDADYEDNTHRREKTMFAFKLVL